MSESNNVCGFNENVLILMNEINDDQKRQQKAMDDLVVSVNTLNGKVDIINTQLEQAKPEGVEVVEQIVENKLSVIKRAEPQPDADSLSKMFKSWTLEVKLLLLAQSKPIVKKYQLLLFPEQDARLFYKIVFGRLFMWLTVMLASLILYKSLIHYIDTHIQVMLEIEQNDRIRKAWNYLYDHSGKKSQRQMDSMRILINVNNK